MAEKSSEEQSVPSLQESEAVLEKKTDLELQRVTDIVIAMPDEAGPSVEKSERGKDQRNSENMVEKSSEEQSVPSLQESEAVLEKKTDLELQRVTDIVIGMPDEAGPSVEKSERGKDQRNSENMVEKSSEEQSVPSLQESEAVRERKTDIESQRVTEIVIDIPDEAGPSVEKSEREKDRKDIEDMANKSSVEQPLPSLEETETVRETETEIDSQRVTDIEIVTNIIDEADESGPSVESGPSQSPLRKTRSKLIPLKIRPQRIPQPHDEAEEETEDIPPRVVQFSDVVEECTISNYSRSIISELRIRSETGRIKLMKPDAHPAEAKTYLKRMEVLFYYLSPCIGIGGVWRFPYMCYVHKGGAFLIPYLIFILICGLPMFHLEHVVAQFTSSGYIKMFGASPITKGAGYATLIVNMFLCAFACVFGTYSLFFMAYPLRESADWSTCKNDYNDGNCTELGSSGLASLASNPQSPSEQYLTKFALRTSSSIEDPAGGLVLEMEVLHLVLCALIITCCNVGWKNFRISFYFLVPLGYIAMTIMMFRGVTLPGAANGLRAFFVPEIKELLRVGTWVDAAVQALFTVGVGHGTAVHRARFNYVNHNCWWEVFCVPGLSTAVSVIFGLVLFSGLGFLQAQTGIPFFSLAKDGPAVMFSVYPAMIATMPCPQLWNVLIFASLGYTALSWIVIQLDAFQWSLYDVYPTLKKDRLPRIVVTVFFVFLVSAFCIRENGIYWFKLLDTHATPTLVIICVMEVLAFVFIYGMKKYERLLMFVHCRRTVNGLWWMCWVVVTPVTLLCVYGSFVVCSSKPISYGAEPFPLWTVAAGWAASSLTIVFIPAYVITMLANMGGTLLQRLRNLTRRSLQFAPEYEMDANYWHEFCRMYMPGSRFSNCVVAFFHRRSRDVDIERGDAAL